MNSNRDSNPPQGGCQGPVRYPAIQDRRGLLHPEPPQSDPRIILEPARKIRPKRGSASGYLPFLHMRRQVWFESTLELDLLQILKKCGPYIGVLEQPAKLDRKVLGFGKGPYTPDYLVWLIGPDGLPRDPVLVEVKYEDDLRKDWRIIHPKVLAGIRFAKRQGWRFALVTERHLREAMPLIPHRRWEPQPSFRLRNPIHVLTHLFPHSGFSNGVV